MTRIRPHLHVFTIVPSWTPCFRHHADNASVILSTLSPADGTPVLETLSFRRLLLPPRPVYQRVGSTSHASMDEDDVSVLAVSNLWSSRIWIHWLYKFLDSLLFSLHAFGQEGFLCHVIASGGSIVIRYSHSSLALCDYLFTLENSKH